MSPIVLDEVGVLLFMEAARRRAGEPYACSGRRDAPAAGSSSCALRLAEGV